MTRSRTVRDILAYVGRVLAFLIIGPVIGGVLFILIAPLAGDNLKGGLIGSYVVLLLSFAALPFFLVGCYMLGWKAALITGLIVGIVGPYIRSRLLLLGAAAIVGAVAAVVGTTGNEEKSMILIAIVGAVSSAGCSWFLDRIDMMRATRPA